MKQKIVITLKEASENDITAFCEKIIRDGVEIKKAFSFGVIAAETNMDVNEMLRKYPEVQDIRIDMPVNLPPPSSDIQ